MPGYSQRGCLGAGRSDFTAHKTLPLPLELDARGLILCIRRSLKWWRWYWGTLRYVIDNRGGALIGWFVSGRQSTLCQHASSLPLDQCVSTRRRPLCLVLHATLRFLCHAISRRVHVFVRDVSTSFDNGLATWLDLDTVGVV